MPEPDAIAVVALLPTDQGGRAGPTPDQWFGCVLATSRGKYDVRLKLDRALAPGSTRRVAVYFLDPANARPGLTPGTQFDLWEGGTIGFGRIEAVPAVGPLAAE
jgi:hypothetical protein